MPQLWRAGQRVEVYYGDSGGSDGWYPGDVREYDAGAGTYAVDFDDGTTCATCPAVNVRAHPAAAAAAPASAASPAACPSVPADAAAPKSAAAPPPSRVESAGAGCGDGRNPPLAPGRSRGIDAGAAPDADLPPPSPRERPPEWTRLPSLQGPEQFASVARTHMGLSDKVLRLVVCVKMKHAPFISDVVATEEATGFMHLLGNKGGQAVALKVGETSLCFINSHLAAHQGETERRDSDVREIISGISGAVGTPGVDVTNELDALFWFGDLNYRIDTQKDSKSARCAFADKEAVLAAIAAGRVDANAAAWTRLLAEDQLRKHFRDGQVFAGFEEAGEGGAEGPAFPPTFKRVKATGLRRKPKAYGLATADVKNTGLGKPDVARILEHAYDHQRVPSWCDRILCRTLDQHWKPHLRSPDRPRCVQYRSAERVTSSDHKPVYAIYEVTCRTQCSDPFVDHAGHGADGRRRVPVLLLSELQLTAERGEPFHEDRGHRAQLVFVSAFAEMQQPHGSDLGRTRSAQKTSGLAWPCTTGQTWQGGTPARWSGETVRIPCAYGNKEYLNERHVVVLVERESEGSAGGTERTASLGQFPIPLRGRLDGEPHEFGGPVINDGVRQGTLKGVVVLQWEDDALDVGRTESGAVMVEGQWRVHCQQLKHDPMKHVAATSGKAFEAWLSTGTSEETHVRGTSSRGDRSVLKLSADGVELGGKRLGGLDTVSCVKPISKVDAFSGTECRSLTLLVAPEAAVDAACRARGVTCRSLTFRDRYQVVFASLRERERFAAAMAKADGGPQMPPAPKGGREIPLRVFVGTWNLGNEMPDNLGPWLAAARDCDIVAIGAQECDYTYPAAGCCAGKGARAVNKAAPPWARRRVASSGKGDAASGCDCAADWAGALLGTLNCNDAPGGGGPGHGGPWWDPKPLDAGGGCCAVQ